MLDNYIYNTPNGPILYEYRENKGMENLSDDHIFSKHM